MSEGERAEVAAIRERFPEAILKVKTFRANTFICLKKEFLREVGFFLRDDDRFEYKYFSDCTCVDYSTYEHARDLEERFEVVYNLFSLKGYKRIFLKVGVEDGETTPSLIPVYAGAEYSEREVWDLFGVVFEDHPSLKRFLLPDDWVGFPLRKNIGLGGEEVVFAQGFKGPAVEDLAMPHAGESFEGKTGSEDVSGR
ncbi:MAG TPA: NADH-quinone oxidoreductase subunit C [Fimbriimonadales bacterium]|jgi:NADH-quinone oxidoreductase subunit C|nr:NADH-quinone oxidoreductase subunit C [Fimbriimonadales bacterium]